MCRTWMRLNAAVFNINIRLLIWYAVVVDFRSIILNSLHECMCITVNILIQKDCNRLYDDDDDYGGSNFNLALSNLRAYALTRSHAIIATSWETEDMLIHGHSSSVSDLILSCSIPLSVSTRWIVERVCFWLHLSFGPICHPNRCYKTNHMKHNDSAVKHIKTLCGIINQPRHPNEFFTVQFIHYSRAINDTRAFDWAHKGNIKATYTLIDEPKHNNLDDLSTTRYYQKQTYRSKATNNLCVFLLQMCLWIKFQNARYNSSKNVNNLEIHILSWDGHYGRTNNSQSQRINRVLYGPVLARLRFSLELWIYNDSESFFVETIHCISMAFQFQ